MKIAINTRFLLPNRLEGIGWFTYQTTKRWVEAHPEHEFVFIFSTYKILAISIPFISKT